MDWDEYGEPLTYEYNTQVNRSNGTTPFSLILTRQPQSASTVGQRAALPTNGFSNVPPRALRLQLLTRLADMKARTYSRIKVSQGRYKRHYDRRVHVTPYFKVGQQAFIDQPQGVALASKADRTARAAYDKLMHCTKGLNTIFQVDSHTITVNEDGIHSTVSIDRAKHAPGSFRAMKEEDAQDLWQEYSERIWQEDHECS